MGQQKSKLVIQLRKRGVHDLGRHEVGEHLFHPHIVEPAHRHQIAKPHVRRFMRDHAGAVEPLILCRGFVEQQRRGVVENRAGVLHATELERGNQHEVELAEGVRNGRVALEPLERRRVQIEDGVAVPFHLGCVRFAVEQAELAAVPDSGLDGELACDEREQIRGQRLRLGKLDTASRRLRMRTSHFGTIGNRLPVCGNVQRERVPSLQVRLVEAGKRQVGAGGHEQRVQELVVSIERFVTRGEDDGHLVRPRLRRIGREYHVTVLDRGIDGPTASSNAEKPFLGLSEIEDDATRRLQGEPQDRAPLHRARAIGRNAEAEVVTNVADR